MEFTGKELDFIKFCVTLTKRMSEEILKYPSNKDEEDIKERIKIADDLLEKLK